MVLHNPNNWHWVNKDVSAWTKDYLSKELVGIKASKDDGTSAEVSKVLSMDGDVDVSQRKGKVITIFDVRLQLEYTGKVPVKESEKTEGQEEDTKDVSGTITIPEVAHDTEEDEYVFEVEVYSSDLSKEPVKELVRKEITPQIRTRLQKLGPALIAEHGKDLQHAPGSNPSSGFSTPKILQSSSVAKQADNPSKSSTASTAGAANGPKVNVASLSDQQEFRTTAEQLFETFTDPQRIAAFTRAPPKVFEGAKEGAKFEIFGGNVSGSYTKLDKPTYIEQKWRLAQWPQGHYSTLKIKFEQNDVDAVTIMRVDWEGVPIGQEDPTRRNWAEYYVRSIKTTFGFAFDSDLPVALTQVSRPERATMPSMEMRLAWVQKVNPATLGAHLEAYINLLPKINTLRLCNRFGKGDDVVINRLPVELVKHIECYMADDEREDTLGPWVMSWLCFMATCDATDHYGTEELTRLHEHYFPRRILDDKGGSKHHLTAEEMEDLEGTFADDEYERFGEVLPGIEYWRVRHDQLRRIWTRLVGEPGEEDRGFFSEKKHLIRKHFGLDVWMSHVVHEERWYDEDFTQSTITFLTLPDTVTTRKEWSTRIAGSECSIRLPTETSYELAIVPPAQPSEKSLARFARAMKILGLEAVPLTEREELVADRKTVASELAEDSESDSDEDGEKKEKCYGPALRLLVANKDDTPADEI